MTLTINSILENRYRIENKLGQDGFGAEYPPECALFREGKPASERGIIGL